MNEKLTIDRSQRNDFIKECIHLKIGFEEIEGTKDHPRFEVDFKKASQLFYLGQAINKTIHVQALVNSN